MVNSVGPAINITADVPDILNAASVPLSSIDFAIRSHHHSDHTGDLSLFSTSTSLAVGPGFKSRPLTNAGQLPGPTAETLHEAFEGRELDFSASTLRLAGLRAIDDDGSLYLLGEPHHHGARAHVLGQVHAPRRGRCVPLLAL